jgi:hypothetical protein
MDIEEGNNDEIIMPRLRYESKIVSEDSSSSSVSEYI